MDSCLSRFSRLFGSRVGAAVVGMVHVQALPGTPRHQHPMDAIVERACREAALYQELGLDGVLVENMHDVPYLRGSVGPEITAGMARVCSEVRRAVPKLPLGVQILSGANKEALAVAHVSGANFIRAEGYVFSHVADEGWMDACAGELLRYRKSIGAENVLVFTDVKKKHSSHAVTADLSIAEMAEASHFFLSDGVVLTGQATGSPVNCREMREVRDVTATHGIPLIIGSGVTETNVEQYYKCADALIVGSHFKENSHWMNDVDRSHVERFMENLKELNHSLE